MAAGGVGASERGIVPKQPVTEAAQPIKQQPKAFGVGASAHEPLAGPAVSQPGPAVSSLGRTATQPKAQAQPPQNLGREVEAQVQAGSAGATAADLSLPLVETAHLVQGPSDSGGLLDSQVSATGVASAPPAAHSEFATSTTSVDVRLPSLAVPESVAGELATARRGMADAQREMEVSHCVRGCSCLIMTSARSRPITASSSVIIMMQS